MPTRILRRDAGSGGSFTGESWHRRASNGSVEHSRCLDNRPSILAGTDVRDRCEVSRKTWSAQSAEESVSRSGRHRALL